ncbi:MAG: TrkA C-terminal domain-containing protein [Planctomycetota bacterium]
MRRLRLAGATQVVSPFHVGGVRIAQKIVRPAVVDFIELSHSGAGDAIKLEEVQLMDGCAIDGVCLSELPTHGVRVLVVAIKRDSDRAKVNPGPGDRVHAGNRIVVVGDRGNLERLALLSATP